MAGWTLVFFADGRVAVEETFKRLLCPIVFTTYRHFICYYLWTSCDPREQYDCVEWMQTVWPEDAQDDTTPLPEYWLQKVSLYLESLRPEERPGYDAFQRLAPSVQAVLHAKRWLTPVI